MSGVGNQPQSAWAIALKVVFWGWTVIWAIFTVLVGVSPQGAAENLAAWLRFFGWTSAADYIAGNPIVAVPLPEYGDEIVGGALEIPQLLIISLVALALGIYMVRARMRSTASASRTAE